jgi:DNA-binding transcriptional MerR regulator
MRRGRAARAAAPADAARCAHQRTNTHPIGGGMTDREDEARGDAAPDKRYYRIGEVAKITDVKPYVLRYWESEFRWMAPQKSRSQQRLYRRRDIDMILLIKKLLYEQRFTIAGARKKLRDMGIGTALETGDLVFESDQRARFKRIRDELASIRTML